MKNDNIPERLHAVCRAAYLSLRDRHPWWNHLSEIGTYAGIKCYPGGIGPVVAKMVYNVLSRRDYMRPLAAYSPILSAAYMG